MLATQITDYLDVFQETVKYTGTPFGFGIGFAFIGVSVLIALWFMSGMPVYGFFAHKVSSRAHNIIVWVGMSIAVALSLIGAVMAVMSMVEGINEVNKLKDVQTHMKENVAKKYDATLNISLTEVPLAGDRDKPHDYTLILNDEDKEKRVEQRYEIRFDRATSEPFISELVAPTADELESAAKK